MSRRPETWDPSIADMEKLAFGDIDAWNFPSATAFEEGEPSLAAYVLSIAVTCRGLSRYDLAVLKAIYQALMKEADSPYQLQIKSARRGPKRSMAADSSSNARDDTIFRLTEFLTGKLGKKEAAIAEVRQIMKLSRTQVFEALARVRSSRHESG